MFFTEFEGVQTLFEVNSSKLFTVKSGEVSKDTFSKYALAQNNIKIRRNRKENTMVEAIAIGCADTCNLACSYCYAGAGTYGNKSNHTIMTKDDFQGVLSYINSLDYPIQTFNFFGGEPLLAFNDIKSFVCKVKSLYKEKYSFEPIFSTITNGTLINEEVANFLNDNFEAVSISVDGPKEIFNHSRVLPNNRGGAFDLVVHGMSYFQNIKDRKVFISASSTLTPETIDMVLSMGVLKFRDFFYNMGFDDVFFFQATGVEYDDNTTKNFDEFWRTIVEDTFEKLLITSSHSRCDGTIIPMLSNILSRRYSGDCSAGKNYFYFALDGNLYPCQLYYNNRQQEVSAKRRLHMDACQGCPAINVCSSHCGGASLDTIGNENTPLDFRCRTTLYIFELVIQRLGYYLFHKETGEYNTIISNVRAYAQANRVANKYPLSEKYV